MTLPKNLLKPDIREANPESRTYEGGSAVDRRLFECGRGRESICKIIKVWCQTDENKDRYYTYCTVWDWLFAKAKEEGKALAKLPCTPGGLRLSLEYITRILNDAIEINFGELRKFCNTRLDEYLLWEKSELAAFIFHVEQQIETKRIKQQFRIVRSVLLEEIQAKNMKAVDMWTKMTGKNIEDDDDFGIPINVVNEYVETGELERTVSQTKYRRKRDSLAVETEPKTEDSLQS